MDFCSCFALTHQKTDDDGDVVVVAVVVGWKGKKEGRHIFCHSSFPKGRLFLIQFSSPIHLSWNLFLPVCTTIGDWRSITSRVWISSIASICGSVWRSITSRVGWSICRVSTVTVTTVILARGHDDHGEEDKGDLVNSKIVLIRKVRRKMFPKVRRGLSYHDFVHFEFGVGLSLNLRNSKVWNINWWRNLRIGLVFYTSSDPESEEREKGWR